MSGRSTQLSFFDRLSELERAQADIEPLSPRGVDTSKAAAQSVRKTAPAMRAKVLAYIKSQGGNGSTTDQAEVALGMSHQTCSARVHELAKLGAIEDSGVRRKTRSGRTARVYVVTGGSA